MPEILAKPPDLVDRLAALKSLQEVPRTELEWLVAHGLYRRNEAGEVIAPKDEEAVEFVVMITGRSVVTFERGTGHRHSLESKAGSLTGLLPYSRLIRPLGDVVMAEAGEQLIVHRDQFPEMIRECPKLTAKLVHTMVDRARTFAAMNWQDEKLLSLGRLAAGLAHELNNPASAAARSATLLPPTLTDLGAAAFALGAAGLTDAQRALIDSLVQRCAGPGVAGVLSPVERADREEAIADWLDAHGADTATAASLAEHGVTAADLDALAAALSGGSLDAALRWIAAANASRGLATDVERSATRIHDLVGSVKRFSYVDRAGATEPTDVAQSLADIIAVLSTKAKGKSVRVSLDVAGDLPRVPANTAALNQVWSNLLENALDAVPESGEVSIHATRVDGTVVVRVVDNGTGIPADVQQRMFDPFYTTKKIGEGSGLGLDIARRVVRSMEGQIDVETRPGRTEFRVSIPVGRG